MQLWSITRREKSIVSKYDTKGKKIGEFVTYVNVTTHDLPEVTARNLKKIYSETDSFVEIFPSPIDTKKIDRRKGEKQTPKASFEDKSFTKTTKEVEKEKSVYKNDSYADAINKANE